MCRHSFQRLSVRSSFVPCAPRCPAHAVIWSGGAAGIGPLAWLTKHAVVFTVIGGVLTAASLIIAVSIVFNNNKHDIDDLNKEMARLQQDVAELKQQSQGNYRNYLNTQLTDAGFVAAQSAESVFAAVYRSIQSTDTYAKNLGTT